jgi:hypothetical protein
MEFVVELVKKGLGVVIRWIVMKVNRELMDSRRASRSPKQRGYGIHDYSPNGPSFSQAGDVHAIVAEAGSIFLR